MRYSAYQVHGVPERRRGARIVSAGRPGRAVVRQGRRMSERWPMNWDPRLSRPSGEASRMSRSLWGRAMARPWGARPRSVGTPSRSSIWRCAGRRSRRRPGTRPTTHCARSPRRCSGTCGAARATTCCGVRCGTGRSWCPGPSQHGGIVGSSTYDGVWHETRELALPPDLVGSPLAARPYDLRHSAPSTWLNVTEVVGERVEPDANQSAVQLVHYAAAALGASSGKRACQAARAGEGRNRSIQCRRRRPTFR